MPDDLLARAHAYAASIADKSGKYTAAIYLAQLVTRCERAEAEVERLRPLAELWEGLEEHTGEDGNAIEWWREDGGVVAQFADGSPREIGYPEPGTNLAAAVRALLEEVGDGR